MCGICCSVLIGSNSKHDEHFQSGCLILKSLKNRGPDSTNSIQCDLAKFVNASFIGNVLHHQGTTLADQPLIDDDGNIILWNGEIFEELTAIPEDNTRSSDTQRLAQNLSVCVNQHEIVSVFAEIKGPWSMVYWENKKKKLWFGRDAVGRRSLTCSLNHDDEETLCLFLSSVGSTSCTCSHHKNVKFFEFPADGIYSVSFSNIEKDFKTLSMDWFPWNSAYETTAFPKFEYINVSRHFSVCPSIKLNDSNLSITTSLKMRDDVTFEEIFSCYLDNAEMEETVDKFTEILKNSVFLRTNHSHNVCQNCYQEQNKYCEHSSIAILFSGGLDSAVIAALADMHVDPHRSIDLINVAFQVAEVNLKENIKGRKLNSNEAKGNVSFEVPDRLSGRNALEELKRISPNRKWNFIEVNVTKDELIKMREACVLDLVYPCCTVLDDSIGCAIWFAARGEGLLLEEDSTVKAYKCPAKVVLVGMGADEQLAGYVRHRKVFSDRGLSALLNEIELEVNRIWSRNLGRDDRVISDHGREARFPFLDENVMKYLKELPMSFKADLMLPRGIGEKILLRLVAFKLGFRDTAYLAKRAIQFGSRIAKLENRKEKASDLCARLKNSL